MNQTIQTFIIGKVKITYFWKITFMCIVVSMINSLAANYASISALLGFMELGLLAYFLLFRSIGDFTMLSVVLLSLNLENTLFALGDRGSTLYTIYTLPVVKSYLLTFIMICILLKVMFLERFNIEPFKKGKYLNNFYVLNLICFVSSAVMCLFAIAFNDNNIGVHHDLWRYIVRDFYNMVVVMALVACTNYCLKYYNDFEYKIKDIMLGILVGTTWSAVLLILLGNYYNPTKGSEYYITCPLILFFAPGLILFAFEKKNGWLYFFTGILAAVIQIKFTVGISGTWWMYIFAIAVVFLRNLFSLKSVLPKFVIRGLCWLGILVVIVYICIFGLSISEKGRISHKLISFLRFFNTDGSLMNWYSALGGSIQTRFEGMLNAIIELIKKPWFSLLGKGYGGSVKKYWGISNWNYIGSTFPDAQIFYETYSSFHVAVTEIIINFGMLGVVMIVSIVRHFVQEIKKKEGNMWIVIGTLWFVFFYTLYNSFNLGLVCLCYGLFLKESSANSFKQRGI